MVIRFQQFLCWIMLHFIVIIQTSLIKSVTYFISNITAMLFYFIFYKNANTPEMKLHSIIKLLSINLLIFIQASLSVF